ncbi:MAG: BlaI/MecI/CopY family transcriptional regulator [Bacteroidota bacterium]
MAKEKNGQPTASELAILQVLWQRGPLPVKEVHAVLEREKEVVYTTILKTMQVMHERGFLARESQGRKHIYQAAIAQEDTQNRLLDSFVQRTFGGSAKRLVMRALGNMDTTKEDLEELKSLIQKLENDQ